MPDDPVNFYQRPESGSITTDPPQLETLWCLEGIDDESGALGRAMMMIPYATAVTNLGILYRGPIQQRRIGYKLYHYTCVYGRYQTQVLQFTFSGSTQGGTANMRGALEHIADYYDSLTKTPLHRGLIGVHRGEVEGVDVIIPALSLQVDIKYPIGHVSLAWVKLVAGITGKTNKTAFLGFDPGEVLYRGMTFRDGTSQEAEVSHDFGISANATGLTIAGLDGSLKRVGNESAVNAVSPTQGIAKKGWEVAWIEWGPDNATMPQQKAQAIHIERVYESAILQDVLGFGDNALGS